MHGAFLVYYSHIIKHTYTLGQGLIFGEGLFVRMRAFHMFTSTKLNKQILIFFLKKYSTVHSSFLEFELKIPLTVWFNKIPSLLI